MKHKITLDEEEVNILLEALDSADWYCEEDCEEFWKKLERLRKKLRQVLDPELRLKRKLAGRIGWSRRKIQLRRELLGIKLDFEEGDSDG